MVSEDDRGNLGLMKGKGKIPTDSVEPRVYSRRENCAERENCQ